MLLGQHHLLIMTWSLPQPNIYLPSFIPVCPWVIWCPRVRPTTQYSHMGPSSLQMALCGWISRFFEFSIVKRKWELQKIPHLSFDNFENNFRHKFCMIMAIQYSRYFICHYLFRGWFKILKIRLDIGFINLRIVWEK